MLFAAHLESLSLALSCFDSGLTTGLTDFCCKSCFSANACWYSCHSSADTSDPESYDIQRIIHIMAGIIDFPIQVPRCYDAFIIKVIFLTSSSRAPS